ncbi:hypothetical protein L195_g024998 [Trifolium pratense]|uniref:Uncharacterized protein n=2 Tax=Trifolium pratense TaxID=57577 RepID=A0A2K3NF83_TRIPR|nr:hypothetical protein L195_g024998 [Trifolium pratense]
MIQTNENNQTRRQDFRGNTNQKWCKPNVGVYKVNNDVNLTVNDTLGLGATIQDANGTIMAATWKVKGFADATT